MTLWLKEDTMSAFFDGWGLENGDGDEVEVTQIPAGEGELAYKVENIANKNLVNTDISGLERFLNRIDGRYHIDTDSNGEVCIFIHGPEEASGGFEEMLPSA